MFGRRSLPSLFAVAVVILSQIQAAGKGSRGGNGFEGYEEAAEIALFHSGLSESESYTLNEGRSGVVSLTGDQTPFLHEQINGRELWQITVDSVRLKMVSRSKFGEIAQRTDSTFRTFKIYVDPQSRQIIKISSAPDEDYPHKPPIPPADAAEKQLQSLGMRSEFYHGFPETSPKVSFLEALNSLVFDPFSAREIHALYILHSRRAEAPHPVWIIDLRGLEPAPMTMGGPVNNAAVSIEEKNHRRTGVDAVTGVHLFTTTVPQMPRTNND